MNLHLKENDLLRDVLNLGEKMTALMSPTHKQSKLERVSISNSCDAGCIFSLNAFGEIFKRELLETRLCNCELLKIKCNSQLRHETLWLGHHTPLKKRGLTRRDTSARGYTRTSEAFPSTFSLSPCLGLSQRECTASIRYQKEFERNFARCSEKLWQSPKKQLE